MRIPQNAIRQSLRQRRVTYFTFKMFYSRMFDVENFIEAVKARPVIYNSKHKNFNRRDVRAETWDEIGEIMFANWDSFDDGDKNQKRSLMQKKWKSLKDCFNREVRLQKSKNSNALRKKYEFYDKLLFLHNIKNNKAPKSIDKELGIKVEEQTPPESSSLPQTLQRTERRRKIKMKEFVKPKPILASPDSDSDKLFLMSFIDDFKMLPLSTKYWVKMKFSEIMHQAAMSLDGGPEVNCSVNEFLGEGGSPDSSSEIFVCQQ